MEIVTKPMPRPVRVDFYEFKFVGETLVVDVWPTQGDTVEHDTPAPGDFTFRFPRLKFVQVVEKHNRLGYSIDTQERLYVDAKELQRDLVKEVREKYEGKRSAPVETADE